EKTLNDLGMVSNSTVLIRGEDDEGERVNLELSMFNMELDQSTAATTESFTLMPDLQTIPKKTPAPTATTTDAGPSNGHNLPTRTSTKRTAADAELDTGETEAEQIAKRGKVAEENNAIVVDDDGAIMLD
ncbi:hypothetical protein KCU67_g16088, partial [Aureobasidium melanogenum]